MSAVCPQGHTSESTDYCDTCGAPIGAGAGGASGAGGGAAAGAGAATTPPPPPPGAPAGVTCPHCSTGNVDGALFCEACGYDFTTGAMPRGSGGAGTGGGALDLGAAGAGGDAAAAVTGAGGAAAAPAGAGTAGAGAGPAGEGGAGGPRAGAPGGEVAAGEAGASAGEGGAPAAGTAGAGAGPGPIAPPVPLEWVAEVWVDPDWYAAQDQADQPCPSPGLPTTVPLTVRSLLVGRVSRSRNIHPEIDCGSDSAVSRRQAQLTTDGTRWFVEDLQSSNGTYVGPASGPLPTVPLVAGQRRELAEDDRVYVGAWTRLVVRRATDEERAAG